VREVIHKNQNGDIISTSVENPVQLSPSLLHRIGEWMIDAIE
jgi:hypothetical protein